MCKSIGFCSVHDVVIQALVDWQVHTQGGLGVQSLKRDYLAILTITPEFLGMYVVPEKHDRQRDRQKMDNVIPGTKKTDDFCKLKATFTAN